MLPDWSRTVTTCVPSGRVMVVVLVPLPESTVCACPPIWRKRSVSSWLTVTSPPSLTIRRPSGAAIAAPSLTASPVAGSVGGAAATGAAPNFGRVLNLVRSKGGAVAAGRWPGARVFPRLLGGRDGIFGHRRRGLAGGGV